jgi:H+/Cl- antiporter ClcA
MFPIEVLAGFGIFAGCLARAVLPFLKKKGKAVEKGQTVKWDNRFLWTAVFSLFIAGVTTMLILPTFQVPGEFIFPAAFIYGWTAEDIVNKVAN